MAVVFHLGLLRNQNSNCRYGSRDEYASSCSISYRSIKPLWRYDFSMAAVRHFELLKIRNFNLRFSSGVSGR